MMKQQLVIFLSGEFDSDMVATVRERLGLRKRGRLSDDWDANFGYRRLGAEPNRIWLDLHRDDDASWNVTLAYETEPVPAEEMERLRRLILDTAAEVGVEVTRQVPPPPGDGTIPPERVAAARERLAAWQTEHSMRPDRTVTAADLEGYLTKPLDEFVIFSTPGRSNLTYLVSDDLVYAFAPSLETLETALANARGQADGER